MFDYLQPGDNLLEMLLTRGGNTSIDLRLKVYEFIIYKMRRPRAKRAVLSPSYHKTTTSWLTYAALTSSIYFSNGFKKEEISEKCCFHRRMAQLFGYWEQTMA